MERLTASMAPAPQRPVKVLQFGEGNFLRAFVDYFIDIANEKTDFNGSIALVKPINIGTLFPAFKEQDYRYTVMLRGLVDGGVYTDSVKEILPELWKQETDAEPKLTADYPWLSTYQQAGRAALQQYLGTDAEQDYEELSAILEAFHNGADHIWLKRMGRTEDARWYDNVDFSDTNVLIIEWTHGNSDLLKGVDIPVLLNSTPEQTRAHRRARSRDGKTDSAFTTMVLEIEQAELDSCAHKAKIIIAKTGERLSFDQYRAEMEGK